MQETDQWGPTGQAHAGTMNQMEEERKRDEEGGIMEGSRRAWLAS
jgi:hypothetical protein